MIEIEYSWQDVCLHIDAFKLGKSICINKEECRLVGMKIQVRNSANMLLKLTYATHDEMRNIFGSDFYNEE